MMSLMIEKENYTNSKTIQITHYIVSPLLIAWNFSKQNNDYRVVQDGMTQSYYDLS